MLFLIQDGITNGAIYALLGLALVLVFAVTRVILIPQGEFVTYGALTYASLSAGQMLIVSNLASNVIGSQRDSLGDLRNMQVDVDVTDGSGRVLPFIESVDNASGDIMVRTD